MLRFTIARIAEARGITNPREAMKEVGLNQNIIAKILGNSMALINPFYLEKLCLAFNCLPSDLFEWTPSNKNDDRKDNPLQAIRKKEGAKIAEKLKSLPLDQLRMVEEYINSIETKG